MTIATAQDPIAAQAADRIDRVLAQLSVNVETVESELAKLDSECTAAEVLRAQLLNLRQAESALNNLSRHDFISREPSR